MLRVKCPQCTQVLGLKEETAGQTARCPSCKATFKVPSPAKKPARPATPAPVPESEAKPVPNLVGPDGADLNPYSFAVDTGPPDKEAIRDDRVDAMVRDARRTKKRNAAWEKIGLPSMLLKMLALSEATLWILIYLYVVMAVVLQIHQIDQWAAAAIRNAPLPKYVWPVNEVVPSDFAPGNVFFIATGIFLPVLGLYGFLLTAAESMKRLERYRVCMTGTIIALIVFPPVGVLALFVLMREDVKHEFEVSERRKQGIFDEDDVEEKDDPEDEEEEEDEESEDEDDEEEEEDEEHVAAK